MNDTKSSASQHFQNPDEISHESQSEQTDSVAQGEEAGATASEIRRLNNGLDLANLNFKYQSVLSSQEEHILYKPIKAYKTKPKNIMGMFQANWRYLMFTNRKLYTLNPQAFEADIINQEKLIVNRIDIDFLNHLIFFPTDFNFDPYYLIDLKKLAVSPSMKATLRQELHDRRCTVILGFKESMMGRVKFNESDIALETNMFVALQLIHSCQMVNLDEFLEHNKDTLQLEMNNNQSHRKLSLHKSQHPRNDGGGSRGHSKSRKSTNSGDGGGSVNERAIKASQNRLDSIQYFQVYMVQNASSEQRNQSTTDRIMEVLSPRSARRTGSNYEVKQFYRSKDSPAEIQVGQYPSILQPADSKFLCDLFWNIESESFPSFIKQEIEEIERLMKQQESLRAQANTEENFSAFNLNTANDANSKERDLDLRHQMTQNNVLRQSRIQSQYELRGAVSVNGTRQGLSRFPSMVKGKQPDGISLMQGSSEFHYHSEMGGGVHNTGKRASETARAKRFTNPTFLLEEQRSFKPYFVGSSVMQKDIQAKKYKLYKPFIMQHSVQLEFRGGDYLFLGVRMSRLLQDFHSQPVQQLVYEKAQIFDETLVDIFPVYSQPKVFLREFVDFDQGTRNLQHRLYFGYLIPKFKQTIPLDIGNIKVIGFKHGVMLLHQFIEFIAKIAEKGLKFGHLDFQNLYFFENRQATRNSGANSIKGILKNSSQNGSMRDIKLGSQKKKGKFSVEFLFIEKNLQNFATDPESMWTKESGHLSHTSELDQDAFEDEFIAEDFFQVMVDEEGSEAYKLSKVDSDNLSYLQKYKNEQRNELKKMQYKINKIAIDIEDTLAELDVLYSEISSVVLFIRTILQYCYRVQPSANATKARQASSSPSRQSRDRSDSQSGTRGVSHHFRQNEEAQEFLRLQDDLLRQKLYFKIMSQIAFLIHQVTATPDSEFASTQDRHRHNLVALLSECQRVCQDFIDIYNDGEYWRSMILKFHQEQTVYNFSQVQSQFSKVSPSRLGPILEDQKEQADTPYQNQRKTLILGESPTKHMRSQIENIHHHRGQSPKDNRSIVSFSNQSNQLREGAMSQALTNPKFSQRGSKPGDKELFAKVSKNLLDGLNESRQLDNLYNQNLSINQNPMSPGGLHTPGALKNIPDNELSTLLSPRNHQHLAEAQMSQGGRSQVTNSAYQTNINIQSSMVSFEFEDASLSPKRQQQLLAAIKNNPTVSSKKEKEKEKSLEKSLSSNLYKNYKKPMITTQDPLNSTKNSPEINSRNVKTLIFNEDSANTQQSAKDLQKVVPLDIREENLTSIKKTKRSQAQKMLQMEGKKNQVQFRDERGRAHTARQDSDQPPKLPLNLKNNFKVEVFDLGDQQSSTSGFLSTNQGDIFGNKSNQSPSASARKKRDVSNSIGKRYESALKEIKEEVKGRRRDAADEGNYEDDSESDSDERLPRGKKVNLVPEISKKVDISIHQRSGGSPSLRQSRISKISGFSKGSGKNKGTLGSMVSGKSSIVVTSPRNEERKRVSTKIPRRRDSNDSDGDEDEDDLPNVEPDEVTKKKVRGMSYLYQGKSIVSPPQEDSGEGIGHFPRQSKIGMNTTTAARANRKGPKMSMIQRKQVQINNAVKSYNK